MGSPGLPVSEERGRGEARSVTCTCSQASTRKWGVQRSGAGRHHSRPRAEMAVCSLGQQACPRSSSHEQKHHPLQTRSTVSICEWCYLLRAGPLAVPAMLYHAVSQPIIAFSAELNKYWLHLLTTNNPAWCIYCHATDIIILSCPLEETIANTQSYFQFFHGWKK